MNTSLAEINLLSERLAIMHVKMQIKGAGEWHDYSGAHWYLLPEPELVRLGFKEKKRSLPPMYYYTKEIRDAVTYGKIMHLFKVPWKFESWK